MITSTSYMEMYDDKYESNFKLFSLLVLKLENEWVD